ncbi:hypothetical protein SCHAM137S_05798 [Streptomyces chartreusis]
MDAVAHRGAPALGPPAAAPGHGVVRGVAVPGGLAVRDQRAAHGALGQQAAYVPGAGSEAVLEDDRGIGTAVPALLGLYGVEVGEARHRRLLAPRPRPCTQGGDGLVAVERGRGADDDQVGPLLLEHPVEVGVAVEVSAGDGTEGLDRGRVDVDGGDEFRLALLGEPGQRGEVRVAGDGAGADHGDPDAAAGERSGVEPVRAGTGSGLGCCHGRDQTPPGRRTTGDRLRVLQESDWGAASAFRTLQRKRRPRSRSTPVYAWVASACPGPCAGAVIAGRYAAPRHSRSLRRRRVSLIAPCHNQHLDSLLSCLGSNHSSSDSSRG